MGSGDLEHAQTSKAMLKLTDVGIGRTVLHSRGSLRRADSSTSGDSRRSTTLVRQATQLSEFGRGDLANFFVAGEHDGLVGIVVVVSWPFRCQGKQEAHRIEDR